jgi:SpoVK/Ycf46/Vps4 family AAA+-type ATPase
VARTAVWQRYLRPAAADVDLQRLVEASEMFTPADIEFAARKGAQTAFEREVAHGKGAPPSTEDYLQAIAETRPTLTDQALKDFAEDTEQYVRM